MTANLAALLLAAGASRRLGTPKQLLTVGGEPLLRRAARALLASEPGALYVVVGAQADEIFATVSDLPVLRVDCADWGEGLAASLRAGIRALPGQFDAALVALCDQPALTAAHLRALVACYATARGAAVASAYAGVIGVPAILPRAWFGELLGQRGDSGARDLLRGSRCPVEVIAAPELAFDVDEPADRSGL
jgi:CTP:molybdopterin cytidylyltransferase MocA